MAQGYIIATYAGLLVVGALVRWRKARRLRALTQEARRESAALLEWARARGWRGGDASEADLAERAETTLGLCATPGDRDVIVVIVGRNGEGPIVVVDSCRVDPWNTSEQHAEAEQPHEADLRCVDVELAARVATPSGPYVVADDDRVITLYGGDTAPSIRRSLFGLRARTTLRINTDRLLLSQPGGATPHELEGILDRLAALAGALSPTAGPYRG
jgi:hypothetical protein